MSLLSKVPPIGHVRQREMLKQATSLAYLDTHAGPVNSHFFVPADFDPQRRHPVVLFFHGGFWDRPMPTQFVPHCLHFAARGAITIAAETRVESVHGTGPLDAIEDAKTFLAWLAEHADNFGIDRERIVIGGASGGAFLALQLVLPKPAKDAPEPPISPKALILFSSLLDTTQPSVIKRFPDAKSARQHRPLTQLRRKLPPMLLFHGKNDRVTPFADAEKFTRKLKWRRNRIELVDFSDAEHSFFNFNVSELHYELTLKAADRFLVDLGILEPDELLDV